MGFNQLRSTIANLCGTKLPKGELWLGSKLFKDEGLPDTPDNHLRLADKLGHHIISLPVTGRADQTPDSGYRYFKCKDLKSAVDHGDLPVFAVIDGPFQDMATQRRLINVLTAWAKDREDILKASRTHIDKGLNLIADALEHPVSAIVIADDFASDAGPMVSPDDIEMLFSPFYAKAFEAANNCGIPLFLHSCGDISRLVPIFKTWRIEGFCAVQNGANDLISLYRQFDENLMIMAGIELELLEFDPPPDQGLSRFQAFIKAMGKTGNLILGTSCGLYESRYLKGLTALYDLADQLIDKP